jgi:hypothetical protein
MVPAGLLKGDEDAFGTVLLAQWGGRSRGRHGAAALAARLLLSAAREAGLLAITDKRVRPGQREAAQAYLRGTTDGSEPLPLQTACALVGLDPARVRRAVLRKLGPGDAP